MRAAVIKTAGGPVEIQEHERPTPGSDEVLIRVRACGLCHGDLMVKEGQFPFARYPVVPGHEIAGVIEAIGERVQFLACGTRVGLSALFSSCGVCSQCLGADEFLCEKLEFTGITKDGGFQEYVLAPAAYVAPIPESIGFVEAAPLMCAGLTVFSGMRHAGFEHGNKVAVIGLGGLGHMAVLFAKSMGGRVAVISTSANKKAEAEALGAEQFIHAKTTNTANALKRWDGADLILATAPDAEVMAEAFPGLAPNGTMMVLGAPFAPISVSAFDLIMGRRRLMGSPAGSRKDLMDMLAFAELHGIRPQVNCIPLEHLPNAFEEMGRGHMSRRTVVVME
ncbi:MAG TPA: alcohol dehydrogenase catalytic domain-containing protein [Chthoniobacterales bacterium]|nr:alcohol dehydrogenase catalytic domain-containing protein [Chthoniobacterales bacterium]